MTYLAFFKSVQRVVHTQWQMGREFISKLGTKILTEFHLGKKTTLLINLMYYPTRR